MRRSEIKTVSPFKDLFGINQDVLSRIIQDMRMNGFDRNKPLVIWKWNGQTLLIDGHTRLVAAAVTNIHDVPVTEKQFQNESEAIQYAISCQRNRRNLSDQEIIRCAAELDKRRDRAMNFESDFSKAPSGALGKSSGETAAKLGISSRKVERIRAVLHNAPGEIRQAVESGEMSINAAYNKVMELRRKPEDENKIIARIIRNIEKRLSTEQIIKLINILRDKIKE